MTTDVTSVTVSKMVTLRMLTVMMMVTVMVIVMIFSTLSLCVAYFMVQPGDGVGRRGGYGG